MPQAHDALFTTLADPTRRAIFERLCRDGDQTVGALTARAGVSQPAVSKHLGILKRAGLYVKGHLGEHAFGLNVSDVATGGGYVSTPVTPTLTASFSPSPVTWHFLRSLDLGTNSGTNHAATTKQRQSRRSSARRIV